MTTMTVTFTLLFSEPLTQEERDNIVGNIWKHIEVEQREDVLGFNKIANIVPPEGAVERRKKRRRKMLKEAGEAGLPGELP
jgi:hypothetical protein